LITPRDLVIGRIDISRSCLLRGTITRNVCQELEMAIKNSYEFLYHFNYVENRNFLKIKLNYS
jgi:hypothetical protein